MQSTKDHPMLFREKLKRASNRLVVSGTVRRCATEFHGFSRL